MLTLENQNQTNSYNLNRYPALNLNHLSEDAEKEEARGQEPAELHLGF